MKAIPSSAKGSFSLALTPEYLANRFKNAMLPPVLATPAMIMIMENAALNAIDRDSCRPAVTGQAEVTEQTVDV